MSYLVLPDGIPDFSKAVISFWFRVPLSSMTEAIAQRAADSTARMAGIIPLLTFGPMFEGYRVITSSVLAGVYTETHKSYDGTSYHVVGTPAVHQYAQPAHAVGATIQINPSHVGVYCDVEDGVTTGYLSVRFQMRDFGSGAWVDIDQPLSFGDMVVLVGGGTLPGVAKDTAWTYAANTCLHDSVAPDGPFNATRGATDNTALFAAKGGPESFALGGSIPIAPDRWHHALISLDLGGGAITGTGHMAIYTTPDCTVGDSSFDRVTVSEELVRAVANPAKMWIAVDDIDFVDAAGISGRGPYIGGLGNNGVATPNAYRAAGGSNAAMAHIKTWEVTGCVRVGTEDTGFGISTYSYTPTPIPCAGYEFGIPAVPALVDRILPVEMAELQFFADVTLDTSDAGNRRAFIDKDGAPVPPVEKPAKDEAGNPILDAEGKPVMEPPPAEKLLGKKPSILLHGSGNWIAGRNTGTEPTETPDGSFDPTGLIVQYHPDPSLNGPQAPAEEPAARALEVAD